MSSGTWTYKVHVVKPKSVFSAVDADALESELNRLGSQGWELVKVRGAEASRKLQLILKRLR